MRFLAGFLGVFLASGASAQPLAAGLGALSAAHDRLRASVVARAASAGDAPEGVSPRAVWTESARDGLLAEWKGRMGEFAPALERHLRESGTEIVFAKPGGRLFPGGPSQVGQYEAGTVYINELAFARIAEEVFEKVPAEESAEVLALVTLPILVHEAEHGALRARMGAAYGVDDALGSKENEFLAHYRQAEAASRIYEAHGKRLGRWDLSIHFENRGIAYRLSNAFGRGLFSLSEHVEARYHAYPSKGLLDPAIDGTLSAPEAPGEGASHEEKRLAFYARELSELRREWESRPSR